MSDPTARSSHWSLTINNPTPADDEEIARARQRGWRVTGQLEKGKDGTPHFQLHLATPQVRFSAVKKAFTRAHIEPARNATALETYVNKAETREGNLPSSQEKYPSLSRFWQLVFQYVEDRNWVDWSDPDLCQWFDDAYNDLQYPRPRHEAGEKEFANLVLDSAVGQLIRDGYHVDHYYSPPNRNLWTKFHFPILQRAHAERCAQTDRQTDTRSVDVDDVARIDIPDALSSCPSQASSSSPSPQA